jgi:hypothetical protein
MGLVDRLEAEFLPLLRTLEAELRERYPDREFTTGSSPTGRLTSYQGHTLHIECLFPAREASEPDNVALTIDVCHLDQVPQIMAGVCWGHPGGMLEDSLDATGTGSNEDWPEASDQTLTRLSQTFPRLADSFARAVSRGRPAD